MLVSAARFHTTSCTSRALCMLLELVCTAPSVLIANVVRASLQAVWQSAGQGAAIADWYAAVGGGPQAGA